MALQISTLQEALQAAFDMGDRYLMVQIGAILVERAAFTLPSGETRPIVAVREAMRWTQGKQKPYVCENHAVAASSTGLPLGRAAYRVARTAVEVQMDFMDLMSLIQNAFVAHVDRANAAIGYGQSGGLRLQDIAARFREAATTDVMRTKYLLEPHAIKDISIYEEGLQVAWDNLCEVDPIKEMFISDIVDLANRADRLGMKWKNKDHRAVLLRAPSEERLARLLCR